MSGLDKPVQRRDEAYRAWVRSRGCVFAQLGYRMECYGEVEFHHVKPRGARGSDPLMGGSDWCGLGLCWNHHVIVQSSTKGMLLKKYAGNFDAWYEVCRNRFMWDVAQREA